MRPHAAVLALVLALSAGTARPGPWPREAGTGFLSLSHSLSREAGHPSTGYSAFYGELGLGGGMTLGLDAGRGDTYGDWSALFFLRRSLDDGRGPNRLAAELGLGRMGADGTGAQVVLRPGLSWGRGLPSGWATLESYLEYRLAERRAVPKADLTLGLKPGPDRMLIFQLQSGDYPGAPPYLRLAPSYVQRLGRGEAFVEIGLKAGLAGDETLGLKLGLWRAF